MKTAQDTYIEEWLTRLDDVLWTFQWSLDRANNFGEVSLDRETQRLVLHTNPLDSDDPEGDALSLILSRDIDFNVSPEQNIRDLIHFHLCHEADEQMWFNNERPFYPHNEDGSLRDV
jgi:hypothetical protein